MNKNLPKIPFIIFLSTFLLAISLNFLPVIAPVNSLENSAKMVWTQQNSDPNTLGWMKGFPPPADKIIRFDNGTYFQFPQLRWSVCHFQQLMPTKSVAHNPSASISLERAELPEIDQLTFIPWGKNKNESMTWQESLDANFTDGIIILHHGKIVYDKFFGCLTPNNHHAVMSMTKSLVGLLGEMLVAENKLQENRLIRYYIPELAPTAFGDATVRQVLDMTTALDYTEDYKDPNAGVWKHAAAGNPLPKPQDYTGPRSYFEFLQTVQKKGEHGTSFGYKTINTDVLGWLISRVTEKPITEVLSDKIWRKIGTQSDGFFSVDSIGTPFAGGGFNANLYDMARFGQMMLNNGRFNGKQIVPEAVINKIRQGGDRAAALRDRQVFARGKYSFLKGWSYRSMWWITHNEHEAYMARGVHGQSLYIDPQADMVIARFASHPTAGNIAIDPTTIPAYEAIGNYLSMNNE